MIVLQQFDGNILGPKILGSATGISSFWVVVTILLGGGFFGVLGMFLGVPVFACLQELVKHLIDRRLTQRNMPTEAYAYVSRDKRPRRRRRRKRQKIPEKRIKNQPGQLSGLIFTMHVLYSSPIV